MPLLPYAKLVIESPLAPDVAEAALVEHVEIPQRMRWPGEPRLNFAGEVGDAAFAIRRIVDYRGSFRPQVRGTIEAAPEGSRIVATMELPGFVLAGLLLMVFGLTMQVLSMPTLPRAGVLDPFTLVPPAMLVLLLAMSTIAFSYEARRARELLVRIVRGRELP